MQKPDRSERGPGNSHSDAKFDKFNSITHRLNFKFNTGDSEPKPNVKRAEGGNGTNGKSTNLERNLK